MFSRLFKFFIPSFYKGMCFSYTFRKKRYGAIVLEEQLGPTENNKYFLVAITDELPYRTISLESVLSSTIYTMAWFSEENMPKYNVDFVGHTNICRCFHNKYGMNIVVGKAITCTNCGQSSMWKHKFRIFNFGEKYMRDLI